MSRRSSGASQLKNVFSYIGVDRPNWFPGHMAKGLRMVQKRLRDVDCIVEVHDARIPLSGRNPNFQDKVIVKPHLLVLNKVDLTTLQHKEEVETRLHQSGVNKILYTNFKNNRERIVKEKLLPSILELIQSQSRFNREKSHDYSLLIIGIPNVGKSSMINAIRNDQLKQKKATRVGALPGVTRGVLEKIRVSNDPLMYLYDTPGIMPPSVPSRNVGMKLALCAAIKDSNIGEPYIVDYMLNWYNKMGRTEYVDFYGFKEPTDNTLEFLTKIAKDHNKMQKRKSPDGGHVLFPDFQFASTRVLKDFRSGNLGKVNLDEDFLFDNHVDYNTVDRRTRLDNDEDYYS